MLLVVKSAPSRDRTYDLEIKSLLLYHLSYRGITTTLYRKAYCCQTVFRRSVNSQTVCVRLGVDRKLALSFALGSSECSSEPFSILAVGSRMMNRHRVLSSLMSGGKAVSTTAVLHNIISNIISILRLKCATLSHS